MIELIVSAFLVASATQADAPAAATAQADTQTQSVSEETAPAAPSEPAAATAPAKPKKTCRRLSGTGSRMDSGKVCKTAVEWKRFDAEQ